MGASTSGPKRRDPDASRAACGETGPVASWAELGRRVERCRACPRLVAHRERAARERPRRFAGDTYWARAVPGFGDPEARLLIVGLAPAAHGANRTGRMFTGDRSGDWLYETMHRAGFANRPRSVGRDDGLRLRDAYLTSVVHCAPPDNRPRPDEIERCRAYLVDEILRLRRLRAVVVLGQIALNGFLAAWRQAGGAVPSPRPRFGHDRAYRLDGAVTLLTSYHPSQQNTFTGRLTRPMFESVFGRARSLVRATAAAPPPRFPRTSG